jgi:hypothetical protein
VSGSLFQIAYQISPIILSGGIAQDIPGQLLPIVALTEGVSAVAGALVGAGLPSSLNQFFAQFTVIPGGNLISQEIGHYPFANQAVAANAVITEPLTVSVRMDCPANSQGSYLTKLATLTALQATLSSHNAAGGLYTIATPGFIYQNLIMTRLTDISGSASTQVQYQWQFDFEQPLVTLQAAQQVYSNLLAKIGSGTQISGVPSWSGIQSAASSTLGNIGSTIVSGASNLGGAITGLVNGL